ncbi:UNVERIFIED_CONTAM: hypothetical protein FKN15_025191 [Acipenser sinensis]
MNTLCPPKRVPSANCFFYTLRSQTTGRWKFGHDQGDCTYEDPCFWEAYSMGRESCVSGWLWLLQQQTPSPPQAKGKNKMRRRRQRGDMDLEWEEPERPVPEWEDPERPQPKKAESVRPQPKVGKAECP